MIKKILLTLLIALCIVKAEAQIAYYDALTLSRHLDADQQLERSSDSVFMILDRYIQPTVNNTKQQIIDSVNASTKRDPNPFLEISGGSEGDINARIKKGIANGLSSVSGLDVTTIANGIATFMIERSKEELTVAFFNRFKNFVEENQEFKVLFPKTTDNLENLLAYKYPEMLAALRSGFFEDIRNITYHLDDVLELPRYQELLKNFPEIRVAIRSIRLIHEIESGESHPADVLTKFAKFTEWNDPLANSDFQNFGNTVKLANIFSTSLRDSTNLSSKPTIKRDFAKAWISFDEVQKLITDTVLFKLYLGLIYESAKAENIRWYFKGKSYVFTSIMEKQQNNIFIFENKVIEFIELASEVDNTLDTLQQKKKNKIPITNDDYYNYINTSLDVIEYGFSIADIFIDNDKFVVSDYAKIARKSNDLYRHIYKEEYTQAVSSAMDIYKSIKNMLDNDKEVLFTAMKAEPGISLKAKSFDKLTDGDITSIAPKLQSKPSLLSKIKALVHSKNALEKYDDFIAGATKYGLFMSNLVNAKSEEEVQAVLESSALPVGSSSIKKNSCINIAVQSYLGAYWTNTTSDNFTEKAWANKFGVIAPIGFSFSVGLQKCGSFSLFTSLLDLGAIVDYKLKYDTIMTNSGTQVQVSKDYKVELGQIFSPGAYVVYGFPWNLPLSFGFGGQYGPGLSSIDSSNNTVVDNPYWRWSAFIAVDIPLFNVYNKERKR